MPEGKVYPKCFDAYLLYAIWTGFEYFSFFNETKFKLFLLTEFKKAGQADDFAEKMNRALSERAVDLGPADVILQRTDRSMNFGVVILRAVAEIHTEGVDASHE